MKQEKEVEGEMGERRNLKRKQEILKELRSIFGPDCHFKEFFVCLFQWYEKENWYESIIYRYKIK